MLFSHKFKIQLANAAYLFHATCCFVYQDWKYDLVLRLVFTSVGVGVGVGVVIRRAERCDLLKIKLSELEVEHRFCL